MNQFFQRLRQRKLVQWAVAYVAAAFALLQGIDLVSQRFSWPENVERILILLSCIGFFVTLVLAWFHGERGDQKVSGTELLIIGLVLLIGGGFLWKLSATARRAAARPVLTTGFPLTTIPEKSIAVLPFESLSEDKSNTYFAEGIQDEILTRLSKIGDLQVISRTSTEKYKSAPDNLREIAQQLGVANILEGSVQKAGDQVRITVQLINARKDDHLWAETYDRTMSNIFGVESDVAEKIAGSLAARLTGREKKQIAFEGTKIPAAHDAFLHGLALRGGQSAADRTTMIAFFRHAVELDPNYAQAWAMLGAAELDAYPSAEQKEKAREEIETSLRLAPDLEDGQVAMGLFKYYALQDYDGALAELKLAHQQEPNDWSLTYFSALIQRRQGQWKEAIRGLEETAIRDPLNEDVLANLARTYRGLRRLEEARTLYDRALTIAPNESNITAEKAETYMADGDLDRAWGLISQSHFSPRDTGFGVSNHLLLLRHQFDEALRRQRLALAEKKNTREVVQVTRAATAYVYLMKNDRAAALPYVEEVRRERAQWEAGSSAPPILYCFSIFMEAAINNRPEVEREIKELFARTRADQWEFPNSEWIAAGGYVLLHDLDQALPLLEDALRQPSAFSLTTAYLRLDPLWDDARSDPRFQALLKKHMPNE